MKATVDLPDDVMREVKVRAATQNRRIKDVMAEALRRGLFGTESRRGDRGRLRFPLIDGTHPASAGDEVTPERAAAILVADDAESLMS